VNIERSCETAKGYERVKKYLPTTRHGQRKKREREKKGKVE
jgi:hypothetical protein